MDPIISKSRASIVKTDLQVLCDILKPRNPQHIVEIGTWKGFSAQVWLEMFQPESFVTIELDDQLPRDYDVHVDIRAQSWYGVDSHDPKTIDMLKIHIPKPLDFLFIDGDHRYEGVKKDWEMYSPLVKPGGIVALHDCLYREHGDVTVNYLWEDLKFRHAYTEIKTSAESTGMGVIYV